MSEAKKFWFPAKRYGWGWGIPDTWQGWSTLAVFLVLLAAIGILLPPSLEPRAFAIGSALLFAALIGICYAKGEPPRWRWGSR